MPNPARFPSGLSELVRSVTGLKVNSTQTDLRFGIWFEVRHNQARLLLLRLFQTGKTSPLSN